MHPEEEPHTTNFSIGGIDQFPPSPSSSFLFFVLFCFVFFGVRIVGSSLGNII